MVQATQDIEKRGFTAAGWAEKHGEFARIKLQADVAQRFDLYGSGVVDLADIGRTKDSFFGHASLIGLALL